jgi:hypothetical protein
MAAYGGYDEPLADPATSGSVCMPPTEAGPGVGVLVCVPIGVLVAVAVGVPVGVLATAPTSQHTLVAYAPAPSQAATCAFVRLDMVATQE